MSCLTFPRTEKSTCYTIHYGNSINNMITTSFIPKFYTLGFKRLNISLCPGISPTLNRATHNPIFKHDPSKPSYLNRTHPWKGFFPTPLFRSKVLCQLPAECQLCGKSSDTSVWPGWTCPQSSMAWQQEFMALDRANSSPACRIVLIFCKYESKWLLDVSWKRVLTTFWNISGSWVVSQQVLGMFVIQGLD